MKEVNVRDHPRRTMKECFEWSKANATGRWDMVKIGKSTQTKMIYNETGLGSPEADANTGEDYTPKLREASATRERNWGEFMDDLCIRNQFGNAVLKQFVRVVIAFELDSDAKAFRRWLRAEDQP